MLPDLTEDEKCDRFMRGLPSAEVRAILRNIKMDPKSLNTSISVATSYEAARVPNYKALARHLAVLLHVHFPPSAAANNNDRLSTSITTLKIKNPTEMNLDHQFGRNNLGCKNSYNKKFNNNNHRGNNDGSGFITLFD